METKEEVPTQEEDWVLSVGDFIEVSSQNAPESAVNKKEIRNQKAKEFWQFKRKKERQKRKQKWKETPKEEKLEKWRKSTDNYYLWKGKKVEEISWNKPNIVIDFSFARVQEPKEVSSVCNQLLHAYGFHRRLKNPYFFHITSFDENVKKYFSKMDGYLTWKVIQLDNIHSRQIFYHEDDLLHVFKSEEIIYLTADAEEEIEKIDPSMTYVIGGISDNGNFLSELTYKFCKKNGLKMGKLPLDRYIHLSKFVLNVNHVFEIICKVAQDGNWEKALATSIPMRYGNIVDNWRVPVDPELLPTSGSAKKVVSSEVSKEEDEGE